VTSSDGLPATSAQQQPVIIHNAQTTDSDELTIGRTGLQPQAQSINQSINQSSMQVVVTRHIMSP